MKMVTVENFLHCMRLEMAGKVLRVTHLEYSEICVFRVFRWRFLPHLERVVIFSAYNTTGNCRGRILPGFKEHS